MVEGDGEDYSLNRPVGPLGEMREAKDGHVLPLYMLDEALRQHSKAVYSAPAICVVVRTRHPTWVKILVKAAKRLGEWASVCEPTTNMRYREDREIEAITALSRGDRVLCLGSDAEGSIPARLLAAADIVVNIDEVSLGSVSRAIKSATKARPRGLSKEDISGLDLLDAMVAIRPNSTAASCLKRLRASRKQGSVDSRIASAPKVTELAGYGDARIWAEHLVEDLELWRRGELSFGAIQRNAVLAGHPGVGKSTFVRSVAKSTGLPLFTSSIGQMFATCAGNLDSIVKSIDQLFAEARAAGQSAIVFLDELEGFPSRATLDGREGSWWIPVVNHLLMTLDGAMSTAASQLIVIGATNFPDRLDPALVRPGRLDRVIWIELPDPEALSQIYRQHLGDDLLGTDLSGLGELAIGSSGADVVGHIKSARANARARSETLGLSHLIEAVCPPSALAPDALYRAAVHEAGHAVAAIVLGGCTLMNVTLGGKNSGGRVIFERSRHSLGSADEMRMEVIQFLCGRAAEQAILTSVSAGAGGAEHSDLARATGIIAANRLSFGLGGTLAYLADPSEALAFLRRSPQLVISVEDELQLHYATAMGVMLDNERAVRAVADALVRQRALTGDEVRAIVSCQLQAAGERPRA